ncbi:MmgE/PrpD family protein [Hydrogenophaga sp. BPS33]|uniref:MmgE/PrpD family protein n=1 Tax=Hydrogenophaga sp. BPS33 TaxID=2651974 RepID=UPI00135C52CF|nr:MmgE/PrpD family protein [Hydrogenophaga sp. BPS33]
MGLTREISEFVVRKSDLDFSSREIDATKTLILDVIGACVSAAKEPVTQFTTDYVKESGGAEECSVFGQGFKTSLGHAALLNGLTAHARELESIGQYTGSNPFTVIPVALAVAEKFGRSGKEVIEAVILALEVQVRLGMAGPGLFDRGLGSIGNYGAFGSTAAAGRLMGLNADQMQNAFGIAISQASGQQQHTGYMTHLLESAFGCRNGVTSASLAKRGVTANPNMIEGKQGFFEVYSSFGRGFDLNGVAEKLGKPYCVTDIFIKKYGACFMNHRSMDALMQLMRQHDIHFDDVERVRAEIPPFIADLLRFEDPKDGSEAKFSLHQALGSMLVDRDLPLPYLYPFSDKGAVDPKYQKARQKIEVIENKAMTGGRSMPYTQPVTVVMKSGQEYTAAVDAKQLKGSGHNPLSREELSQRHKTMTEEILSPSQIQRTIDLVDRLDQLESISELMQVATFGETA